MDVRRLDEMQAQGRSIFDTELAVAYYARVSTDKDEQINSLGNQKRYFEDCIAANPHWTFAGGYVDEGSSGTSVEGREQFLRMIEDAKRGRFDLIITKEISRFARNTLDSLSYTRELLRFGVGVYFQNDNINTFDKDAELRLTIMSSIAQDEVRKLSERTRFGFKRAQENSVLRGQNNLFGYNKVDGRLEIVEHEAAIVREVFERYTAGDLGLRAIANDLERRGICGVARLALLLGVLGLFVHGIADEAQLQIAGIVRDGFDLVEDLLQPLFQKPLIGIFLDLQQMRHLLNFRCARKTLSQRFSVHNVLWHCGHPLLCMVILHKDFDSTDCDTPGWVVTSFPQTLDFWRKFV